MHSRFSTTVVTVVMCLAAVLFVRTLIHATIYAPESGFDFGSSHPGPPILAQTTSPPVRLVIPSLSINAKVQQVGLNAKGEMGIPTNFKDVGWYKYGTVPGQLGSAVIDGHIDNALALPGVFKHLEDIKKGDDVYVVANDGTTLRFVVSEVATYPYTDGPTEHIFGANDVARLNLITCTGTWVSSKHTYNERFVVYTTYAGTVESMGA
jgi:LPXTG-site transpeptidase (sortase) family protein